MKVLIVDDDTNRGREIRDWISERFLGEENVWLSGCISEARRELKYTYFDLMLLDVVIPVRKEEKAEGGNGIKFLSEIIESSRIKSPEKIIGITRYIEDIAVFRESFEKYCFTVIEVSGAKKVWKEKIGSAIDHVNTSKLSRSVSEAGVHIFTVHGIRTFGQWQLRLGRLVSRKSNDIGILNYKYGYFSTLLFFIGSIRRLEVEKLAERLRVFANNKTNLELVVFTHSFGSFLTIEALRLLAEEKVYISISKIVLSGSVLSEEVDLSFLHFFGSVQVINECGEYDYVLWLSKAFVPDMGMAGKVGIYGINNWQLVNRFYKGGHGLFFKDSFLESRWLPLLFEKNVEGVDERQGRSLSGLGVIEELVSYLSKVKPWWWVASLGVLITTVASGLFF